MRNKLNVNELKKYKPGRYADGGGLFLRISTERQEKESLPKGSWVFSWHGNAWKTTTNKSGRREMGLGPYPAISLAKARKMATECRELIAEGIDPKAKRDSDRQAANPLTFEQVAMQYLDLKEKGWKNEKHKKQWRTTIDVYCAAIKGKPVERITKDDVLSVLKPLWTTRHETARRVLGRMRNVIAYSIARDIRSGPNPAEWTGNIEFLVEQVPESVKQPKHYAALDYVELPAFFERVRSWNALAAKALTLLILTASRTGEVLNAEWDEFDLEQGVWVIPGDRMKMGKPHAIPLPDLAVSLLQELATAKTGNLVFEGRKRGRPMSNSSMLVLLSRNEVEGVTPHGFRSTFRDWCQDKTSFEGRIAEHALAHSNPDKVEASYLRSSAFDKRKQLMQAWCDYCEGKHGDNVVELRRG